MLSSNTTNSSLNLYLNYTSCHSSSDLCSPVQACPATAVHLAYISVICVVGVLGNILLLYANYKQWKKRHTPDKVLIFNLAISNLAALLISFPLHAVVVANSRDYLMCIEPNVQYYVIRFYSIVLCNFVTLATMVVVGIDRYQALTMFPHQRTLNVKKSILAIGLAWLCSLTVVVVFIVITVPICINGSKDRQTDRYAPIRITIVSIWITVCCTITCTSLLLAARRIQKHRQKITAMFGPVQGAAEISFTKGIIALSLCYIVFWIPYGVVSGLYNSHQTNNLMCFVLWTASTCYFSFTLLPGIYFIVDKRLREVVVPQTRPVARTTRDNHVPSVAKTAQENHFPTVAKMTQDNLAPSVAMTAQENHNPTVAKTTQDNHVPSFAKKAQENHAPIVAKMTQDNLAPSVAMTAQDNHNPTVAKTTQDNHVPSFAKKAQENHAPMVAKMTQDNLVPSVAMTAQDNHAGSFDWDSPR